MEQLNTHPLGGSWALELFKDLRVCFSSIPASISVFCSTIQAPCLTLSYISYIFILWTVGKHYPGNKYDVGHIWRMRLCRLSPTPEIMDAARCKCCQNILHICTKSNFIVKHFNYFITLTIYTEYIQIDYRNRFFGKAHNNL